MQGVYITHRTENYCAGEKVDKNNELIRNLGKLIMSRCILHPNSRYETSWISESAEVRSHIHIRDPAGKQGDQEIERDEAAHLSSGTKFRGLRCSRGTICCICVPKMHFGVELCMFEERTQFSQQKLLGTL